MLAHYLRQLLHHGRIDPLEYYVCERYKIVYVENAKVACTAIKQLLFPEISYRALGQDAFHDAVRTRALFSPPGNGAADYLHFSIFREPVARLISCYRNKIQGAAAHGAPGIFQTGAQRLIFAIFGAVDVARPGLGIAEFADAVSRVPDRLRDRHIMSQATIFRAVMAGRHSFIGRHENLDADWAELSRRTGLPHLPKLNASGGRNDALAGLPASTLARLHKAYAADYALLGYEAAGNTS